MFFDIILKFILTIFIYPMIMRSVYQLIFNHTYKIFIFISQLEKIVLNHTL